MIVSTIPGHSYFINSPVDGTVSTADGSIPLLAFKAGVQVDFSAPADAVRVLPDDSRIIVRENFKSAPARAAAAPAGADVTPEQIAAWDAASAKWTATPFTAGEDAQALGCGLAIGTAAEAHEASVALGVTARAPKRESVAVGYGARVLGDNAVAVGACSYANISSTSVGYLSAAENDSVSVGERSYSSCQAVAVGDRALATCALSVAVGKSAESGHSSVAVGYCSKSYGINSVVVGASASTTSNRAVVVGSKGTGEHDSVAVGHYARATTGNIAIGADSLACAVDTTVLGTCAYAMANSSTVVGAEAYTTYSENVVVGAKASSTNTESVVVGYHAVAKTGYGSVAVGAHARATFGHSVVVGNSSSLEGYCYPGTLVGPNLTPPAHIYSPVAVLGAGSTCTGSGQLAIYFYRKEGDVFMGFQTIEGSNVPVYKEVSMTNLFNLVQ